MTALQVREQMINFLLQTVDSQAVVIEQLKKQIAEAGKGLSIDTPSTPTQSMPFMGAAVSETANMRKKSATATDKH